MRVTGFTHISRSGNTHRAEPRFRGLLTGSAPTVHLERVERSEHEYHYDRHQYRGTLSIARERSFWSWS